jgi:hypothetical protein
MPEARYFLPDHPELQGEYSREDLRLLLQSGKLSRSDMVMDDETGLAHLLGALLASPYYLSPHHGKRRTDSLKDEENLPPAKQEPDPGQTAQPPARMVASESGRFEEASSPESMEFRAATPLRQREIPELEVDHYGEEEEEDEGEIGEEEDEDEEEDLPRGPVVPEAYVPRPSPVFQAAMPQEEELLYHGHPSWLSYPKALAAFMAFAGISILCQRLHYGMEWCITAAALALLCLAFVALDRMTTEYFVTTRRVEMESGLIGRSTKEIRIADIRAIDVTQTMFAALLGVGTIDFSSAAGREAEVRFANVYRPHRLKQTVRSLQE